MIDIYNFFKASPLKFSIPDVDKKLKFIEYKYTSREVTGASIGLFIMFLVLTVISIPISMFLAYLFMFVGAIMVLASYMYPTNIIYSQRLIQYSEEMLKSILKISTYISMNQSMEYALIMSTKDLSGTLRTQFEDITHRLQRREENTLGEVFEIYTPLWNSYNPDFVKALRLLETATMSPESERKEIIEETIETLMISYYTAGKRSAEQLASNAKTLIAMGVLFPVISLMLLPLVSVFLPDVVNPTVLAFMYNVFFIGIIFLMALNFS